MGSTTVFSVSLSLLISLYSPFQKLPSYICYQLWGMQRLWLGEQMVHSKWCDPRWIWTVPILVWCSCFLSLSYLVVQRMLPPAKAQVHRALIHPLASVFFPAVHSTSKLRWPAKLEWKWISKKKKKKDTWQGQGCPSSITTIYNCES